MKYMYLIFGLLFLGMISGAWATACGTGGTISYDYNAITDKNYQIHRFDSNGTFVAIKSCDINILVVGAGGGGTKDSTGGGGGGGGQVTYTNNFAITAQSYPVVVGSGVSELAGGYSSFSTITAIGGSPGIWNGGAGGASGNGYTGGAGNAGGCNNRQGGGGAGASANGSARSGSNGGNGANGLAYDINGTSVYYGGGGGGGSETGSPGNGGLGGGGAGGYTTVRLAGINGTANTGGGAGGEGGVCNIVGGSPSTGGSGVVIIRYLVTAGTSTPQVKIDFNVYNVGSTTHLTDINMDCNVNALDLNSQNSPFSSTTDQNTAASCQFIKSGYDTNTVAFNYDVNKTIVVYLMKPCTASLNTDWNISTQIDCNFKGIDLGTGKLIISPDGRLRLFDSNIFTAQLKFSGSGKLLYIYSRSFLKLFTPSVGPIDFNQIVGDKTSFEGAYTLASNPDLNWTVNGTWVYNAVGNTALNGVSQADLQTSGNKDIIASISDKDYQYVWMALAGTAYTYYFETQKSDSSVMCRLSWQGAGHWTYFNGVGYTNLTTETAGLIVNQWYLFKMNYDGASKCNYWVYDINSVLKGMALGITPVNTGTVAKTKIWIGQTGSSSDAFANTDSNFVASNFPGRGVH